MSTPLDQSINSIAPIESQQAPNDAQSNPVEMEATANSENVEEVEEVQRSPNKRGLTSAAWAHFKRVKIEDKLKAICKYCERKLGGDTRAGTKHLHDHIRTCKLRTVRGPKQSILKTVAQSSSSVGVGDRGQSMLDGNYTFNQEVARMELAKMIALHEYPLAMVDHIGFRRFCNALQPCFKVITRNTLKADILKMYESERAKTMKLIQKNSSRIAITTDMWTASNQNRGYMTITAHFIDSNWNLQSRLMSDSTNELQKVKKLLEDVVSEYQSKERKIIDVTQNSISTSSSIVSDSSGGKVDWSSDFFKYVQETSSGDCVKSELDLYLEELVLLNQSNFSKFEILGYWKNVGVKYPTLQRIAKDFQAIYSYLNYCFRVYV